MDSYEAECPKPKEILKNKEKEQKKSKKRHADEF